MLNADAELIGRHVELAGDMAWLRSLLGHAEPAEDPGRCRRARSSVAV